MSYRLINANEIANKYPEVNDMKCIYADLPNGIDGKLYNFHGEEAVIDKVLEIVEKRRKDINDSGLDIGTIAVVLAEWMAFENEVLKLKVVNRNER